MAFVPCSFIQLNKHAFVSDVIIANESDQVS